MNLSRVSTSQTPLSIQVLFVCVLCVLRVCVCVCVSDMYTLSMWDGIKALKYPVSTPGPLSATLGCAASSLQYTNLFLSVAVSKKTTQRNNLPPGLCRPVGSACFGYIRQWQGTIFPNGEGSRNPRISVSDRDVVVVCTQCRVVKVQGRPVHYLHSGIVHFSHSLTILYPSCTVHPLQEQYTTFQVQYTTTLQVQ